MCALPSLNFSSFSVPCVRARGCGCVCVCVCACVCVCVCVCVCECVCVSMCVCCVCVCACVVCVVCVGVNLSHACFQDLTILRISLVKVIQLRACLFARALRGG